MLGKIYLKLIASTLMLLLMASACEKPRNGDPIEIIVINNTKDTLCYGLQFNYPDTVLINQKEYPHLAQGTVADPYSKSRFWEFTGWDRTLRKEYKTDGLVCIVYSLDTIRKYPFEQIQQDYNILKRHVLSIEQLKAINWTITYP
jgi:hypothetical protein